MSSSEDLTKLISAASACWNQIARFSWESFQMSGRGAVLVLAEDLLAVWAESGPGKPDVPMNYFAREDVPSGDDFRSLMDTYKPDCQVMLMIGGLQDGEQVMILEASDGQRVRPDSFV
tara:strand:+ start:38622 stop:38975 length:354 start_codon:yes stop_codon:yes gene_type:complete